MENSTSESLFKSMQEIFCRYFPLDEDNCRSWQVIQNMFRGSIGSKITLHLHVSRENNANESIQVMLKKLYLTPYHALANDK